VSDHIRVGEKLHSSTGKRGAFARHGLAQGARIAPIPLAVIPRDDLVIYREQQQPAAYKNVLHKDEVLGHELLLNYCFGHANSSLLLLPLAPVVNWINHHSNNSNNNQTSSSRANAKIQWPAHHTDDTTNIWLHQHPLEVLEHAGGGNRILMELVALRDIEPGEEILIDYGSE